MRPTHFQPISAEPTETEVIWKPFKLVLSPSSHFNLSVQPHTSSPRPPAPQGSRSSVTKVRARQAIVARKPIPALLL